MILDEYDQAIQGLHKRLKEVREAFETGEQKKARGLYADTLKSLEPDIENMRLGVAKMKDSREQVRKISG